MPGIVFPLPGLKLLLAMRYDTTTTVVNTATTKPWYGNSGMADAELVEEDWDEELVVVDEVALCETVVERLVVTVEVDEGVAESLMKMSWLVLLSVTNTSPFAES